jgi:phenylpropionate dioxygenase-like ring-hydroxylating dioxygenase large terminal subunit
MFQHETHLPQRLTAKHYTSPEQYRIEVDQLMLPSWQLVGTTADLKQDGDFFTFELFNYPLIVWRCDGKPRIFLNVCPHRFSCMRSEPFGHAGDRITCQYHGWEFDSDGNTRKIPDAQSFKPMAKGAMALREYAAETCGQLIFVRLKQSDLGLADFLGPYYETTRRLFDCSHSHYHKIDLEVETNWKVKVENAMESYHVDQVHSQTFGTIPEAAACTHEFDGRRSTFATVEETEGGITQFLDKMIHRLAGAERDLEYKHYMFYPNFMFIKMRLLTWAETVIPLGPGRVRLYTILFCHGGNRGGWRSRIARRLLASWGRRFISVVAQEDADIMPQVQRGLAAAEQPSAGVISVREERCFHFQEYVLRETTPTASHATLSVKAGG